MKNYNEFVNGINAAINSEDEMTKTADITVYFTLSTVY